MFSVLIFESDKYLRSSEENLSSQNEALSKRGKRIFLKKWKKMKARGRKWEMFSYFSTYKQFKNAVVSKTAVLQTKLESMRTEKNTSICDA